MHLRDIFAGDPERGTRLTADAAGLHLDYSKHRVTDETLRLLRQLATDCGLAERIEAMFSGQAINVTEQRAVLHVALRAPAGERIVVDGADVVPQVHAVLDRMAAFADDVRSGRWKGHTGRPIRNVVNIGIGGSDLGPGDGVRGAASLQPAGYDLPLRLQHRRHRLRGSHARPRSRGDAVHRLLQDLHDAGDADQRPHGARLVRARARR